MGISSCPVDNSPSSRIHYREGRQFGLRSWIPRLTPETCTHMLWQDYQGQQLSHRTLTVTNPSFLYVIFII